MVPDTHEDAAPPAVAVLRCAWNASERDLGATVTVLAETEGLVGTVGRLSGRRTTVSGLTCPQNPCRPDSGTHRSWAAVSVGTLSFVEEDEWTRCAADLLGEPLVAGGWFRPAHVGAPLAPWDHNSMPSFVSSVSEWERRRLEDHVRLGAEFVTDLPRLMFVAVTANLLGAFDLVGRRQVHARHIVGVADRDSVVVVDDAEHPDWLCLRLTDDRVLALEPAGPDDDVDDVRRVLEPDTTSPGEDRAT